MKYFPLALLMIALLVALSFSPLSAQRVELLIDEGAEVEDPPESLELQFKFEVGEHRRYDINIDGHGVIRNLGMTEHERYVSRTEITCVQHVRAYVPADEKWRIRWTMTSGVLKMPDFGDLFITIPSTDFEIDKQGAIEKMTGLDDMSLTPGMPKGKIMGDVLTQLRFTGFPQKEIKVDDEWEDEYEIKLSEEKTVTIKAESKFLRYEKLHDYNCAVIRTTYETPFDLKMDEEKKKDSSDEEEKNNKMLVGKEKGEVTVHFAYEEGKIIQTSGRMHIIADIGDEDKIKAEFEKKMKEAEEAEPVPDTDPKFEQELRKYDLNVTYHMVSKYNPNIPRFHEEE